MLAPQTDPFPEACLRYQPDPGANNIAVTLWHMAPIFDLFLNQFILDRLAEREPGLGECALVCPRLHLPQWALLFILLYR